MKRKQIEFVEITRETFRKNLRWTNLCNLFVKPFESKNGVNHSLKLFARIRGEVIRSLEYQLKAFVWSVRKIAFKY